MIVHSHQDEGSVVHASGGVGIPGRDPTPGYIPDQPPPKPDIFPPAPQRAPDEEPDVPEIEEPADSPQPNPQLL
jgi:hypothetical protein